MTHRLHRRDDVDDLVDSLAQWDTGADPVPGLHVGDIGWALRDPDDVWSLHGWWDGETLVAAALCERPMARPRLAPQRLADRPLAEAVADVVEALEGDQIWSDAPQDTALRDVLVERGWVDDGDPWACLHLDLRGWGGSDVPASEARACIEDRVAVQVAGFARSTFTREKWRRMSAVAWYRPELDLVVHDAYTDAAAATGTAWLWSAGVSAILEPVATHREHRRAGHGKRIVQALAAACQDQGAAGVTVCTPCSNEAAVATYRAAGFALVAENTAVWLDRREP